jgi:hypothetical protein
MLWNVSSGSSVTLIDSWDDQNIAEYGAVTVGTFAYDSTLIVSGAGVSLTVDGADNDGFARIVSTSGLANYPAKGSIHNVYHRTDAAAAARTLFGCAGDDANRYMAEIDIEDDALELRSLEAGTDSNLAFTSTSFATGTWYRVRIIWDDGTLGGNDNDITVEVYDHGTGTTPAAGTLVDSVATNDDTHATQTGWGVYWIGLDTAGEHGYSDYAYLE